MPLLTLIQTRRLIFLLVTIVIVVPFLLEPKLPVKATAPVRGMYGSIEALPADSVILMAMDYDPSSKAEMEPMTVAVLRQCYRKRIKVIGMTHWQTNVALAKQTMERVAREFGPMRIAHCQFDNYRLAAEVLGKVRRNKELTAQVAERQALLAGEGLAETERARLNQEVADAQAELADPERALSFAQAVAAYSQDEATRGNLGNIDEPVVLQEDKIPVLGYSRGTAKALLNTDEGEFVDKVLTSKDGHSFHLVAVVKAEEGRLYGEDYCFLGYKPGGAVLVLAMGQDLARAFRQDSRGTPVAEVPLIKRSGIRSLKDIDYLVELAAGITAEQWVVYGHERYGFPMGVGCTAVIAPDLYPFLQSGQITGLVGGIKGAWEYEMLIERPDEAVAKVGAQTSIHALIILLIVLCNVRWFAARRAGKAPERASLEGAAAAYGLGDVIFFTALMVFFLGGTIYAFFFNPEGHGAFSAESAGILVGTFLTLSLYSFLYRDNPLFKAAENLYVGVGMGYSIVVTWFDIVKPMVYKPLVRFLVRPEVTDARIELWTIVPIVLGLLILARFVPRFAWLSRWPFAFMVGMTSGIAIPVVIHGNILRQVAPTMSSLIGPAGLDVSLLIILAGVVSVLIYFFYSVEHRGVVGWVSRVGVWFLMVAFGASFGYTVMGRMALFVERVQFLLTDWLKVIQ